MSIWGKILGGAAGLALGGPLGALIGAALGHAVDLSVDAASPSSDAARRISFTIGVIALAAKMARADGEVSGAEIATFRRLFAVEPGEERNVERIFNLARQDVAGYEAYARQIAALFQERAPVLEELLDALFAIAKADGRVHPNELVFLERVATIFGFGPQAFGAIRARHLDGGDDGAYAILGVSPEISDAGLKAHYRTLVRKHHPDRLVAQGMPEEFVKLATERLAAINAAYDQVMAERHGG